MSESDNAKSIREFKSADGLRQAKIVAREDGLFQFFEYVYKTDQWAEYWEPSHESGLYCTANLAEKDACAECPWLRDYMSD